MATKQPADKSHFILPDLGEGVHEAELIKWRVKPGERVDEHQILAEMETDKALVEVPSPWAGVIKELKGKEGDIINVGSILVTYDIGGAGESSASAAPAKASLAEPKPRSAPAAKGVSAGSGGSGGSGNHVSRAGSATAESEAREDAGTVVGTVGGSLSVPARFARRPAPVQTGAHPGKALATPAVRRIARECGIDINIVPGTGRGGRVTASDVTNFLESGGARPAAGSMRSATPAPARAVSHAVAAPVPAGDTVIPFRGVRRKIAQALLHSVHTAVHFTVVDEADVTALDKKRREYARVLGRKLSLLPFVMTAAVRALRKHPSLNANVNDEGEEIIQRAAINLGCAVDTEHGLMVPVIPNADRLSPVQLADMVAELAAQSRDRTIARERLIGGTFTISNVGSYGGMFATPVINYPEVGILAAGRAKERVLVRDGMFYAGLVLPLSLSCDHRVVDGAEGARYLNTVVNLLEDPESLLPH